MVRIPDEAEHRRRWAAIPVSERREVMKAVNRGVALDDRQRSILAVGVARKQQRFWSRAWLLGPVASLLFLSQGLVPFLANAALATVVLGGMSYFWHRRAAQAERANLSALGLSPDEPSASGPEPREDVQDRAGTPHAANPPKRPRRKRR
ncbi:MAG: hypothetical protein KY461_06520 [Actinobacteria bacterium]|nr:hypothetical protein [Actinomycetota bacterium]